MRLAICAGLVLLVPTGAAFASAAEDDLALVKRAVADHPRPAPSVSPAAEPRARETRRGQEPRWLRVRVVDKKGKQAKVSVNLPLGLVRAFGDDLALDDHWRGRDGKSLTLGDVLRTLDAGESIVEVDDDATTVKVWIE